MIVVRRVRVHQKPKIRIGRVKFVNKGQTIRLGHIRVESAVQEPMSKERKWERG